MKRHEKKNMGFEVKTLDVRNEADVDGCFRLFVILRPHLTPESFRERLAVQAKEGYAVVYIEHEGRIAAAAGCRVANFMAWGRVFYVDDLVSDPELRRAGLGGALLDWLIAEGKLRQCDEMHLDTGYQRQDAHRLYLRKGMLFAGHHMALKLN